MLVKSPSGRLVKSPSGVLLVTGPTDPPPEPTTGGLGTQPLGTSPLGGTA